MIDGKQMYTWMASPPLPYIGDEKRYIPVYSKAELPNCDTRKYSVEFSMMNSVILWHTLQFLNLITFWKTCRITDENWISHK